MHIIYILNQFYYNDNVQATTLNILNAAIALTMQHSCLIKLVCVNNRSFATTFRELNILHSIFLVVIKILIELLFPFL